MRDVCGMIFEHLPGENIEDYAARIYKQFSEMPVKVISYPLPNKIPERKKL